MSILLPVYESIGDSLELRGEYEFTIAPARHDVVQVAVEGKFIGMHVLRIEHRVMDILGIRLERRVLNTLVVVERKNSN